LSRVSRAGCVARATDRLDVYQRTLRPATKDYYAELARNMLFLRACACPLVTLPGTKGGNESSRGARIGLHPGFVFALPSSS